MAVDYPYCTEADVTALAGQLAIDLRLDDSADPAADLEWAIDDSTVSLDFYLETYSQADLATSDWVRVNATYFALRSLCLRRLNDVPESLAKECERREKMLELVRQRKANVPRLSKSRRPAVVTGYTTDMRRPNNQIRVDTTKSTGVAKDYQRPNDPSAPDYR